MHQVCGEINAEVGRNLGKLQMLGYQTEGKLLVVANV